MKDRREEIAHCADVLHIEHHSARRSLCNPHPEDTFAGQVVFLFEVEYLASLYFAG
jgi:hypothetical protein